MDEKPRPKHPFNGKLVFEGFIFVITLVIAITFYIVAFHPFRR